MRFLHPEYLWLLAAVPCFLTIWFFLSRRNNTLKNTHLANRVKIGSRLAALLTGGIWTTRIIVWVALVLAACQASFAVYAFVEQEVGSVYFALDTSGSMKFGASTQAEGTLAAIYDKKYAGWQWPTQHANPMSSGYGGSYGMGGAVSPDTTKNPYPTRIEAGLGAVRYFIEQTTHLRIGLVAIDDNIFYLYPATTNHELIVDSLPNIYDYLQRTSAGDNFCGPDSSDAKDGMGEGAVQLFSQEPKDAPHILIMISDGDFSCPADRQEYFKKKFAELNIHMFVFGISSDWANGEDETPQFTAFLNSIGGEVVTLEDFDKFKEQIQHINKIAEASARMAKVEQHKDALLFLLSVAGVAFALSLVLSALRRSSL